MDISELANKYIELCKSQTGQMFVGRRYGTLTNITKKEIYNLEMCKCLEKHYMMCLKHHDIDSNDIIKHDAVKLCEPLILEYMKADTTSAIPH
jgi:hypothetical protein